MAAIGTFLKTQIWACLQPLNGFLFILEEDQWLFPGLPGPDGLIVATASVS